MHGYVRMQVMRGREEQIQSKMETVRQQQEESLERREELINELERVNQLTQRDLHAKEEEKAHTKRRLEEQVSVTELN